MTASILMFDTFVGCVFRFASLRIRACDWLTVEISCQTIIILIFVGNVHLKLKFVDSRMRENIITASCLTTCWVRHLDSSPLVIRR